MFDNGDLLLRLLRLMTVTCYYVCYVWWRWLVTTFVTSDNSDLLLRLLCLITVTCYYVCYVWYRWLVTTFVTFDTGDLLLRLLRLIPVTCYYVCYIWYRWLVTTFVTFDNGDLLLRLLQWSSLWYSDQHSAQPLRVANDSTGCTVRRWAVRQLAPWLSRRQRVPLLPRFRLALLERNRGSQHVPYARQGLQSWRSVALCPQSCCHRLGWVADVCLDFCLSVSIDRFYMYKTIKSFSPDLTDESRSSRSCPVQFNGLWMKRIVVRDIHRGLSVSRLSFCNLKVIFVSYSI